MTDWSDPPASPAWRWTTIGMSAPGTLSPGRVYVPVVKEGVVLYQPKGEPPIIKPPEDVRRAPQGRTCISCGRVDCKGHPRVEE